MISTAINGPLGVSNPISPLPICEAYFRAGQEMGIPFNPDFNGASQEGVGYYQLTQKNARRSSASVAYLKPIRDRKNLTVRTGVMVTRIVVEKGRAIGVEVVDKPGGQPDSPARRPRGRSSVPAPSARRSS